MLTLLTQTRRGRPLVAERFGDTGPLLAIICAIHGNERSAVTFGDRFRSLLLSGWARRRGVRVLFVGSANPDGIAAGSRTNAAGVDLNRNFPAENFQPGADTGPAALSEPETAAIVELLESHAPDAVVAMHCCEPMLDWDGPAEPLAEAMAAAMPAHVQFPVERLGAAPGSMGSWLAEDCRVPVVTFEFACHRDIPLLDQLEAAEDAMGAAADWTRTSRSDSTDQWPVDTASDLASAGFASFTYGTSAEGFDLVAEHFGPADASTLLVAGLADTRRRSLHVAEYLRRVLLHAPAPSTQGIVCVTCANPDGVDAGTTDNAEGRDVLADWNAGRDVTPEAAGLRRLVDDVSPTTIVSVEAADATRLGADSRAGGPCFEVERTLRLQVGRRHGEGRGADDEVPSPRRFSQFLHRALSGD